MVYAGVSLGEKGPVIPPVIKAKRRMERLVNRGAIDSQLDQDVCQTQGLLIKKANHETTQYVQALVRGVAGGPFLHGDFLWCRVAGYCRQK